MASRGLNIFLLIILSFIAGMWAQENREDIKLVVKAMPKATICPCK